MSLTPEKRRQIEEFVKSAPVASAYGFPVVWIRDLWEALVRAEADLAAARAALWGLTIDIRNNNLESHFGEALDQAIKLHEQELNGDTGEALQAVREVDE